MKSFVQFLKEDDFEPTHEGFHGTPDARGIHQDGRFKTTSEKFGEDKNPIYWVAKDHKVAKTYADPHRAFDYQNSEPKVLPVQLSMKNPKHIDWKGRPFRGKEGEERYDIDSHINQARADGHDGVVVKNIVDTYNAKGKASTIMAVFHHKNIRVKK